MGFKHLVILGAGSTIATIPKGDKNGMISYTLDNLLCDTSFASFGVKDNTNLSRIVNPSGSSKLAYFLRTSDSNSS